MGSNAVKISSSEKLFIHLPNQSDECRREVLTYLVLIYLILTYLVLTYLALTYLALKSAVGARWTVFCINLVAI